MSQVIKLPLSQGYVSLIDPEDGDLAQFKWSAAVDKKNGNIYARRNAPAPKRGSIRLHRVILGRMLGRALLSCEKVDHRDGNGLNNCRFNLRLATDSQNQANAGLRRDNHSGYRGVYYHRRQQRWVAQIRVHGKAKHLGYFKSPEEAHQAYLIASKAYFGQFGNCYE